MIITYELTEAEIKQAIRNYMKNHRQEDVDTITLVIDDDPAVPVVTARASLDTNKVVRDFPER